MALALALARAISYAPRVMLQIVVSLTDDSRGINCNMFIVQVTGFVPVSQSLIMI
jgi:hypothetical protein